MGKIQKRVWTECENELFMQRYPLYLNKELIEKFYNDLTIKQIEQRAYRFKVKKSEETYKRARASQAKIVKQKLKGRIFTEEHKNNLSKSMKEFNYNNEERMTWYRRERSEETGRKISKSKKELGQWKGDKNPRYKKPLYGKDNGRWKGGIKQLYWDLREFISSWKKDSMENCNYKCVITGKAFDEIHHMHPFRKLVDMTFEELGLDYLENINMYSMQQRFLIIDKLLQVHSRFPLGVCMIKDVHKQFHDIYGYKDFTVKDFEKFKIKYNSKIC